MTHPFKAPPMEHQRDGLKRAWKRTEYALFWEMGTGKTYTIVNLAAARFDRDQINALVVICPTPIKAVWESEMEQWYPYDYDIAVMRPGNAAHREYQQLTYSDGTDLKVLIVGVEALSQGNAAERVTTFAKKHRCMVVADESSRLKNPNSARTKKAVTIASQCLYRMILTGTPITQGIQDLYSQFRFLNPKILECRSYFVFRNRYCIMGGFEGKQIVGYQNTQGLLGRVSPYVDVVKKRDVLDLPPKVYQRRTVELTREQEELIDDLLAQEFTSQDDKTLSVETVLERLTRFQQIIGGNFPYEADIEITTAGMPRRTFATEPIKGKNPKLLELADILDDLPDDVSAIIWCRFNPETEQIREMIASKFGPDAVVTFVGADSDDDRKESVRRFQAGEARFMISKPQLGGMGQTWTRATVVVYYSNSFSYEDRVQSEDRCHRKGQLNKVTYIDIEANHKYDRMILKALRAKGDVAAYVEETIEAKQRRQ